MSRVIACALIVAMQKYSPASTAKLARECLTDQSNLREWLYEFEALGIARRAGKVTGKGRGTGRSTILWEWTPIRKVENGQVLAAGPL